MCYNLYGSGCVKYLKNNYIKFLIIVLILLIVDACDEIYDNNTINNSIEQPESEINDGDSSFTNKKNSKEHFYSNDQKIYKTSSEEYRTYVDDLFKTLIVTDKFSLISIKWSSPYVKIDYYENDDLNDELFEYEKNEIIESARKELKKNKYKSGGLFKTSFEYISIGFFKKYDNGYTLKTFEQIDVYDF